MFRTNGHNASGPSMAPIISEFDPEQGIVPLLEGLRANNATTQSALLAIIINLSTQAVLDTDLGTNCAGMFGHGVAQSINEFIENGPDNEDEPTESDLIVTRAGTQLDSARVWIVDLVNASKKKELTSKNVESYYSSLSRSDVKGAPIASLINKVANFLPDMINNEVFRGELTDNVWTTYQVSRVSTGKLLHEIRHHFTALEIYTEGDETDELIQQSKDNPHNIELSYQIPKHIIGYASLFFQVAGKDVGKWYQGEKCESEIPAAKVKSVKLIFKRYLEIYSNVEGIEEADTVDALRDTIGDDFW